MSEIIENSTTNRRSMNSSIVQEQHGGIVEHYLNIVNLTTSFSKCLHYLVFYLLAMIASIEGSGSSIHQ